MCVVCFLDIFLVLLPYSKIYIGYQHHINTLGVYEIL